MNDQTDRLLEELPEVLSPPFSIQAVGTWVRTGRPRRRFHALVWLTRVFRFPLS